MAVHTSVITITVGAQAAPAKRLTRKMTVTAGAVGDRSSRSPTQAVPVKAEADLAFEHATQWIRRTSENAEASLRLGAKAVHKVVAVDAACTAKSFVGADGVCSYLRLKSVALDLEGFLSATRHGPTGFTSFLRIYPGEYVFKDAVVRSVMLTREPTTLPKLTRLKPLIDVPDRVIQGSVEITNGLAGATVTFDPPFYTTPEVAVLWQSGATIGTAVVAAPSRTGFTVQIDNPSSPGSFLTGFISYMVQGY